jgi:hypothetical protein
VGGGSAIPEHSGGHLHCLADLEVGLPIKRLGFHVAYEEKEEKESKTKATRIKATHPKRNNIPPPTPPSESNSPDATGNLGVVFFYSQYDAISGKRLTVVDLNDIPDHDGVPSLIVEPVDGGVKPLQQERTSQKAYWLHSTYT